MVAPNPPFPTGGALKPFPGLGVNCTAFFGERMAGRELKIEADPLAAGVSCAMKS